MPGATGSGSTGFGSTGFGSTGSGSTGFGSTGFSAFCFSTSVSVAVATSVCLSSYIVSLPSKRSFAKNLGLSTITIENAYAQLLSEGYIYSIPKKGFYVSDFKNNVIKPVRLTTENVKLSSGQSDFLADFSSNQTRPENFPFSIWAKLMRETFNTNSPELMTKPPCGGIMGLRQAIATHLEQFRGMHVQPEQIFIGAGTEYLY